jgi:hypothetical protein
LKNQRIKGKTTTIKEKCKDGRRPFFLGLIEKKNDEKAKPK